MPGYPRGSQVRQGLDSLVLGLALGLVLPGTLLSPTLSLQVYSLVVVLPKTPLKERISLPCEQLWDMAGRRVVGVGMGVLFGPLWPGAGEPWVGGRVASWEAQGVPVTHWG